MPVALGETVYTPPAPQFPPRKPWTREEYEACERAGLWEGQHYELVQGELINKIGKNRRHVWGSRHVSHILEAVFGWQRVIFEGPIDVAFEDHPTSEPEPDIYVLKTAGFAGNEPTPAELVLIVEISDTTLTFDTTVKAALRARGNRGLLGTRSQWPPPHCASRTQRECLQNGSRIR
jgi:hypothetical protein